MAKIKKFVPCSVDEFQQQIDKRILNSYQIAKLLDMDSSTIRRKLENEKLKITFCQAFTLYANWYLGDYDFQFIIDRMNEDGFDIKIEKHK